MLKIVRNSGELDVSRLKNVYDETIIAQKLEYSEFIEGLYDFLRINDVAIFIRQLENEYVCALRLEPYRQGYLISWLETRKDFRNAGHAKALLRDVLSWCCENGKVPVYTHVLKSNLRSLNVFTGCDFEITGKPAVLLDGSVSSAYHTLIYKKEPTA